MIELRAKLQKNADNRDKDIKEKNILVSYALHTNCKYVAFIYEKLLFYAQKACCLYSKTEK